MSETSSSRKRPQLIARPVQPLPVIPGPIGSPVVTPPPNPLPPPVLSACVPDSGVPGDLFALQGIGLTNTTAVYFIDAENRPFPAQFQKPGDQFSVVATVPNVLAGKYKVDVIVQNPGDRPASDSIAFTVKLGATPPELDPIDPFDPGAGPVGTTVMIHGKHLGSVTSVQFNGAEARFRSIGGQDLMAIVPMNAGTGPVRVVAPAGAATSNKNFVLVKSGPTIDSVSPNTARPNMEVDIAGTQLLSVTSVTFRGVQAQFRVIREKELRAVVPMLSPGQADIVVTNASGSTTFTQFTVAPDQPQSGPVPPPVQPPPGEPPPGEPPIERPGGPFGLPRGGFPREPIDFPEE